MLFNSATFLLVFLPLVLLGFHAFMRRGYHQQAQYWLLVASLVFYGYWNPVYLSLIGLSIVVNYLVGSQLAHSRQKKLLVFGVTFNLALIAYFKYAGFFVATLNQAEMNLPVPDIVLPLAISFFTFQQIAFLVDSYQGTVDKQPFSSYALFVLFFPQLIAGPIVHHKEMMPQFSQIRFRSRVPDVRFAKGIFLLSAGLFKKVVIADYLASWADLVFDHAYDAQLLDAWVGSLAYSLQLYFDFSAYSEMAMGIALLFGIHLPKNFDSPYKSLSIADFWRRWHMTLGRFLRDYLYIPLGGSRHGWGRTVMALTVTMLLGGLWHGAAWTFIVWGGMHGIYLAIHYLWSRQPVRLPSFLAWSITFLAVLAGWVVFRANNLSEASYLLQTMAGLNDNALPNSLQLMLPQWISQHLTWNEVRFTTGLELTLIVPLLYFVASQPNIHEWWEKKIRPTRKWAMVTASMAVIALSQLSTNTSFLYFQF